MIRLQKGYDSARKRGGKTLQKFLNSPFEFPIAAEPLPKKIPAAIDGVSDLQTLRLGNVNLQAELTASEDKLSQEKRRSRTLIYERDRWVINTAEHSMHTAENDLVGFFFQ